MWTPITETELLDQIQKTENLLSGELWNFWQLINVNTEKWQEDEFGKEGNGFWAVAICGQRVVWYNDIEDGFNISTYQTYGQINEYWCNQYELNEVVLQLYDFIKFGNIVGQARGAPGKLT